MEYKNMAPEDFFEFLLAETASKYSISPIRKEKLYYSICGTSIKKRNGVVFGLNWGGSDKYKPYYPQSSMPNSDTLEHDDPDTYLFIKKLLLNLSNFKNIKSINEINYTNLCFFRSKRIRDLRAPDWENSAGLFKLLIEYIDPPWIIFSSIGKSSISRLCNTSDVRITSSNDFKQEDRIFTAYKGEYQNLIPLYTVPYPYRAGGINDITRESIWNWLFTE
jgi:hypothetical protein